MAELIAEFLGTFVLMLFGTGVVAMVVLFPSTNPGALVHGGFTNITLGWGLGVTMGIYVAGKVSGAHLNPAVTLALAVFRDFPWRKVLPYSSCSDCGSFRGISARFLELPRQRFTRRILNWNEPREYSRPSPHFRNYLRLAFLTN